MDAEWLLLPYFQVWWWRRFWQVFWSRLRRQTLVTEKSSPNLNTQHSLKVHVWCFSFGGVRRAGGNRSELECLGLNALRAYILVSGDQLQHLVISRCNSWSVGLFKLSTEETTKCRWSQFHMTIAISSCDYQGLAETTPTPPLSPPSDPAAVPHISHGWGGRSLTQSIVF